MDRVKLFPDLGEVIYLNHASSGPLPFPAREHMKTLIDDLRFGDLHWDFWLERLSEFRNQASRLLGCKPSEIASTNNTTTGLLTALYSIPWQEADNLVTLSGCFPANTVPWEMNLPDTEKKRVSVNPVDSLEERIISSIDENTRAVALDWVDFFTGYRIDLDAVSKACAEHDAFLVVDGIQGCGALHLDLSKVHVDFFSANSAKWLLGPVGSGLLYVNSKTVPRLKPAFRGWMSLQWREFNRFDPLPPLKQGAGRFEAGSYPGLLLSGFTENLKLINTIGIGEVERRIMKLRNLLLELLNDMGADIISSLTEEHASGILTFRFAGADNSALYNHLSENKVKASLREDSIRLSPHFYNTREEAEKVVELIKGFLFS